jgi:hypothetical protein
MGRHFSYDIFGGLPSFRNIANWVPEGHPWTETANILDFNTNFPYITYFFKDSIRTEIKANFHSRKLALSPMRLRAWPNSPRFCRQCITEQLQERGFTYFIREHQLPGVSICWRHHIPLSYGCIKCGPYPINKLKIFLPGFCNCEDGIQPLDLSIDYRISFDMLVWIAEQSAFMVNSTDTSIHNVPAELRMLLKRNSKLAGRRIKTKAVVNDIKNRFGQHLLEHLHYPLTYLESNSRWLRRLLRMGDRIEAIKYILVIGSYCKSIEQFVKESGSDSSIPESPISCSRTCAKDGAAFTRDIDFEQLAKLANVPGISFSNAAKEMKLKFWSTATACLANNIRFPLPERIKRRVGNNKIQKVKKELRHGLQKKDICLKNEVEVQTLRLIMLDEPQLFREHATAVKLKLIKKHRNVVLNFINSRSNASRSMLLQKHVQTYYHLKEQDAAWLDEIMPMLPRGDKGKARKVRVNWNREDELAVRKIEKVIKSNLQSDSKPVWLSKNACIRIVGCQNRYNQKRYPILTRHLMANLETRDGFRRRRIRWAIMEIKKDKDKIGIRKLQTKSCLPHYILMNYIDYIIGESIKLQVELGPKSFFVTHMATKALDR